MPNKLFLLFVQVRFKIDHGYSFRSDDRFLLLLTCPRHLQSCCRDNLFLLLSGDVELNPGPDTTLEEMIKQFLENQKQMSSEIKEVKENQVKSQQRQDEMAAKMTHLDTALDALQRAIKILFSYGERFKS
ncbi:unnamed protein product [Ixodes persulcatus]